MLIRDATAADAVSCAAVYAPYVQDTAVSFELEAPSAAQMAERIAAAQQGHAWLVVADARQVLGYAYGGEFKSRAAYRFACEVSVYLAPGLGRHGLGRALYDVLLPRLAQLGYHQAVAGMTLPNAASEGLHRALGFEPVGVYRAIGWKFERWHDVLFVQRPLLDSPDPPDPPALR
ncbi:GNAT family N-acetyltransferase [uncultured Jatrophihabitans sp.]|uniref:GNAT family N-acetyltransferase n=1 Tax=uncultured Jatrophihabitans sp. TaxID=1610747 RepID=UPI0035CC1990